MSAFSVNTSRQTTPPLVNGVVYNRLVQQTVQFDYVIYGLMSAVVYHCRRIWHRCRPKQEQMHGKCFGTTYILINKWSKRQLNERQYEL